MAREIYIYGTFNVCFCWHFIASACYASLLPSMNAAYMGRMCNKSKRAQPSTSGNRNANRWQIIIGYIDPLVVAVAVRAFDSVLNLISFNFRFHCYTFVRSEEFLAYSFCVDSILRACVGLLGMRLLNLLFSLSLSIIARFVFISMFSI